MLDKYINELQSEISELFSGESSGHDIGHLVRVKNLAVRIAKKEGGNELVVGLSGYVHDVHRLMQRDLRRPVHAEESLPMIRRILEKTDLDSVVVEKVLFCVKHHEHYNWNGANVEDIDALILQDADNLDAIGAIGIGRTFSYGGAHGYTMYDESLPLESQKLFDQNNDTDTSTLHHFYHKLLHLGDYMNTATAKEMAKERTAYMRGFVQEFLAEWEGNK